MAPQACEHPAYTYSKTPAGARISLQITSPRYSIVAMNQSTWDSQPDYDEYRRMYPQSIRQNPALHDRRFTGTRLDCGTYPILLICPPKEHFQIETVKF